MKSKSHPPKKAANQGWYSIVAGMESSTMVLVLKVTGYSCTHAC